MMRPCKECQGIPTRHTFRDGLFKERACAYIACQCGRRTKNHYAFWDMDAADKADAEWEDINRTV